MTRYPSLNGLRAISILTVILYHIREYTPPAFFGGIERRNFLAPVFDFISDGHLGVNIFFVISGFLITSLLINEKSKTGTISLKDFYVRRTLRIFPAYYFLLLVYFVLQLTGHLHLSAASWLTSITYTKYFNWKLDFLTNHFWSLSIEEQFYIFWPFIFTYSSERFQKRFLLSVIAVVPLIRIFAQIHPVSWINDLTLFTRVDSIAIGCFFALNKDLILSKLSAHWGKFFYGATALLFLMPYIARIGYHLHLHYLFVALGEPIERIERHGTIDNLMVAIILMYCIFGPRRLFYKFLNLKFINYIGLLSYSLYLWQEIFTCGCFGGRYLSFPINLLYLAIVSLASYYLIEQPFVKLKSRFSKL